jgi:cytochrome c oxidase subunit IV
MTDPKDGKQYYFDKPENVQKILRVFYVICGLLFAADFVIHRHVYHSWENLPGFYAIYGFVACVVLVLIAVEMRKVLMRSEDYYEDGGDGHD